MASFELHDYESGETQLSFIPQFKKDEFMVVLMYEYNNPGKPVNTIMSEGTFNFDDVVMLRDYLASVIDLYDKKRREKRKRKR